MDVHEFLSDDGNALLALCSPFGLPQDAAAQGSEPFTLSEWNQLARQIRDSTLKTPSGLQGQSAEQLAKALAISLDEGKRIARLLDRSGRLALELESVFARGMWVVTRVDEQYPAKLRDTLKHQAPTVLFGAGEIHLLRRQGVAVIGSRNIDEAGATFAKEIGRKTVAAGLAVVSGGARGTDRIAMDGAMEADGTAIGALADSLETTIRKSDVRQLLLDLRLVLLTSYAPNAGFSVGAAMGRNKVIYGLADFAVVVSSDFQTGGTWAGAVNALKATWCPVFVRQGANVPKGNRELIKLGAAALPEAELPAMGNLVDWMNQHASRGVAEPDLFDSPASPRRGKL
jgi:predicted Rossmann fold nucleotide-binding protein DprA/Smf involved in DNA uptake